VANGRALGSRSVAANRKEDPMRKALPAIAGLLALIGLVTPASAQSYFGQPELRGVGCYWYRGNHYCNRYCWREVDGHHYCHGRFREAGSQAPPPVDYYAGQPPDPRYGRRK
jgi:hypothetical protein